MQIDHLLDLARQLTTATAKRPRQTELRRAVSSVYYALFHTLALMNANQLAGVTRRGTQAWITIYRALDHGKAREQLQRQDIKFLSPQISEFAILFVQLQDLRHEADYDPTPFKLNKQQVLAKIAEARQAIESLNSLTPDMRARLATSLLLKGRR